MVKLASRVSLTFRTLCGSEVVNQLSFRQKSVVFARSAKIFGIEVHNVDLKQLAMLESLHSYCKISVFYISLRMVSFMFGSFHSLFLVYLSLVPFFKLLSFLLLSSRFYLSFSDLSLPLISHFLSPSRFPIFPFRVSLPFPSRFLPFPFSLPAISASASRFPFLLNFFAIFFFPSIIISRYPRY